MIEKMYKKRNVLKVFVCVLMLTVVFASCSAESETGTVTEVSTVTTNDNTLIQFCDVEISLPGENWEIYERESGDANITRLRNSDGVEAMLLEFNENRSNYRFFKQQYTNNEPMVTMSDDIESTPSYVETVEVGDMVIYFGNTGIERAESEAELDKYDMCISMMISENEFFDLFVFIPAENQKEYESIKSEIINSIRQRT